MLLALVQVLLFSKSFSQTIASISFSGISSRACGVFSFVVHTTVVCGTLSFGCSSLGSTFSWFRLLFGYDFTALQANSSLLFRIQMRLDSSTGGILIVWKQQKIADRIIAKGLIPTAIYDFSLRENKGAPIGHPRQVPFERWHQKLASHPSFRLVPCCLWLGTVFNLRWFPPHIFMCRFGGVQTKRCETKIPLKTFSRGLAIRYGDSNMEDGDLSSR